MARQKTSPPNVRSKKVLAERITNLRTELFGQRGGPELARRVGIPTRTWYNYEAGITLPGEVLLRIIEQTRVEPMWLLHGTGAKYRLDRSDQDANDAPQSSRLDTILSTALETQQDRSTNLPVVTLLRAALKLLEDGQSAPTQTGGDRHRTIVENPEPAGHDAPSTAGDPGTSTPERWPHDNGHVRKLDDKVN